MILEVASNLNYSMILWFFKWRTQYQPFPAADLLLLHWTVDADVTNMQQHAAHYGISNWESDSLMTHFQNRSIKHVINRESCGNTRTVAKALNNNNFFQVLLCRVRLRILFPLFVSVAGQECIENVMFKTIPPEAKSCHSTFHLHFVGLNECEVGDIYVAWLQAPILGEQSPWTPWWLERERPFWKATDLPLLTELRLCKYSLTQTNRESSLLWVELGCLGWKSALKEELMHFNALKITENQLCLYTSRRNPCDS